MFAVIFIIFTVFNQSCELILLELCVSSILANEASYFDAAIQTFDAALVRLQYNDNGPSTGSGRKIQLSTKKLIAIFIVI